MLVSTLITLLSLELQLITHPFFPSSGKTMSCVTLVGIDNASLAS